MLGVFILPEEKNLVWGAEVIKFFVEGDVSESKVAYHVSFRAFFPLMMSSHYCRCSPCGF